ncbi:glycoside hydrolase family 97 protein [Prevotella sp. E2-28]|uniref:glycoside hydrolase family 97 protein n=1 Tax=Prevotella sp. E2-28 TaxID=2913620 RepID=UPI001EDA9305|nr:glycoside hydrolase family 97 protein [Prevotella sp. E2-28]UKK54983.1 glycoside hydrolase family 97 protein [Prevotella sp. E2-28]
MGFLPFYLFTFLPLTASAREVTIASPNGKLVVTVSDEGDKATYAVSLNGRQMILPSVLGFKADFGDFTQGLKITNTKSAHVDRSYEMRQVKQSKMHYVAEALTVDFQNAKGQKMSAEFSVSNNDVAFRYLIPRQKNDNPKSAVIQCEATGFSLPEGTTTFLTPQSKPMVGWERTKPSYEEGYSNDGAMTARSQYGEGYTFPCLFHAPEGWVLISETGVDSHYCGSHLSDYPYTIAFPMAGENNGNGTTTAAIALPGKTPWRTITVGETLNPIVETTIPYDVVEPLYTLNPALSSPKSFGRYTWSWLIWQDNSINYDDQVKFIDLASAMGYEFCLVDNWWDQNIGRDRMAELSKYAQKKGVSLMLWYNSNGAENDAPQTPRNCLDNSIARDREMAWLQSIGVRGIKVDFFGGDKQETMKLYEDILFDANRYGIQCIFHGCTLPRGWERMYPNYIASEAVLASENVYFNEGAAKSQPFDLTLHPFCRNAVGTMDWGGVIMNKYMSRDNKTRHTRKTTDAFEIASAFTNQTAIQCIAMQPNNLQELPQAELDFLKTIPTTWDETHLLDGYPGKYVVLARRHDDQWYVAGLNALKEPLTLTLDLAAFNVTKQLCDQVDKKGTVTGIAISNLKLKKGKAKVTMQPNGGFVAY